MNVAGGAPGVAEGAGPCGGLLHAPLADQEEEDEEEGWGGCEHSVHGSDRNQAWCEKRGDRLALTRG